LVAQEFVESTDCLFRDALHRAGAVEDDCDVGVIRFHGRLRNEDAVLSQPSDPDSDVGATCHPIQRLAVI